MSGAHTGASALLALLRLGEAPPDRSEAVAALRAAGETTLADALERGGLSPREVVDLLGGPPAEVAALRVRERLHLPAREAGRFLADALHAAFASATIADVARALGVDRRQAKALMRALEGLAEVDPYPAVAMLRYAKTWGSGPASRADAVETLRTLAKASPILYSAGERTQRASFLWLAAALEEGDCDEATAIACLTGASS
jgi:plasmid maintenance system antidote protein VapI